MFRSIWFNHHHLITVYVGCWMLDVVVWIANTEKRESLIKSAPFRCSNAGNQLSLMAEETSSLNTSPGTLTSSATSPQPLHTLLHLNNSYVFSDSNGSGKMYSDAISIRSLASIGMGSTDGRKMIIRRVPNTPAELLSIVNPPMWVEKRETISFTYVFAFILLRERFTSSRGETVGFIWNVIVIDRHKMAHLMLFNDRAYTKKQMEIMFGSWRIAPCYKLKKKNTSNCHNHNNRNNFLWFYVIIILFRTATATWIKCWTVKWQLLWSDTCQRWPVAAEHSYARATLWHWTWSHCDIQFASN